MTGYRTEQRSMLLRFLTENRERAFTVEEAVECMRRRLGKDAPGKSTVYRLMTRLVEERAVKRFVSGNSRRFVYQLLSEEPCRGHFHLKCTGCGKLFHLDEKLSSELREWVQKKNAFAISAEDTVFFGYCAECKARG